MIKDALEGNAVLTSAVVVTVVAGFVKLLRAYGYDITGDQENALLELLRGPVGDWVVVFVGLVMTWVARSNVYSRLSVANLTGVEDPKVP